MKQQTDYLSDLQAIRSMMQRSSKFLSLSGWSGVMAGIYGLLAAYIAVFRLDFDPIVLQAIGFTDWEAFAELRGMMVLAALLLVLSIGTAAWMARRKANKQGEVVWTAASRRLLADLAVPLLTGGMLLLAFTWLGAFSLLLPISLLFYGITLYQAGPVTYTALRILGLLNLALGFLALLLPEHAMLFWAAGFGLLHIVYGLFIHFRYEK
ncbi:MAG: hypothetical protein C0424_12155 [Sphingobacteriaceae bacterium]|nr:hypothetical protein [Sphingobacteriaceae bacterium]